MHAPLYLGVEDTLIIGTAVHNQLTGGNVRPALADYCGHVDMVLTQGLGNLYVVRGYMLHPDADPALMLESKECVTDDPDGDLVKLLEYAASRGVYSMTIYTSMTRSVVTALRKRCGEYYLGNNLGEVTSPGAPPGQKDMKQAANAWVRNMRKIVRKSWRTGQPHVTCTITNLFTKYCLEAGMDIPTAEIFTLPLVDLQFSILRGAARGYGQPLFGGWLATGWFSGSNRDPLKPLNWKLALHAGFMHGSNFLIEESGHWGLHEFCDTEDENHPLCRNYRRIQKQFHAFSSATSRPADGPDVRIGLVQGRFDGYWGGEGDIWGQPGWTPNANDQGWELLKVFYPAVGRVGSMLEIRDPRYPRFSGTPYGLVDIVPAETPADRLLRYRSLLFLGWNTMDDDQYRRLKAYVKGGGRLVMWASHMNASADRRDIDTRHRFLRDGDFRDLFGTRLSLPKRTGRGRTWRPLRSYVNTVEWTRAGSFRFPVGRVYYNNWPHGGIESVLQKDVRVLARTDRGQPFVTESRLGKGRAILVHCSSPQGQGNYRELAEDIFHAVGRSELPPFRPDPHPTLAYACYGKGRNQTLYVLNTDRERTVTATIVGCPGAPRRMRLGPAQLRRLPRGAGNAI